MLFIKLTEREDGSILAETPNQVIGRFSRATRQQVIAYLEQKAALCDERVRIVGDFDELDDDGRPVNFKHLMKRRF